MKTSTSNSIVELASARNCEEINSVIELLESRGKLDSSGSARLKRAMAASKETPTTLIQQLGLAKEIDVVSAIAEVAKVRVATESDLRMATDMGVNLTFLRNSRILPLQLSDDGLVVAMADPFDDAAADALSYQLGEMVERYAAPLSVIETALAALTQNADPAVAENQSGLAPAQSDLDALQDLASDAPVIKRVTAIFDKATQMGASDVHFESTEDALRVRFRIDGALRDMEPAPFSMKAAIVSRLKILARLDIAETRLPQDGRAKIAVRGSDIDLRVSTAPTLYGESVVVRILDRSSVELELASLGFSETSRRTFTSMLEAPHGLVLVTGPTGSGKTTSLYAALRLLNDSRRKIFSVEDPVEYRIAGINQVQINPKIGLTFATALRSLLRQDPDVMMVGEIRDSETAEIAIQAALTGHLVLATLHTNNAASAITRLSDMGVEEYLIGASLVGVVAQRLVGVLCPKCAQRVDPPSSLLERYGVEATGATLFMRAVGCEHCGNAGYSGRTTICEVLRATPAIEAAIASRASISAIERVAVEEGMTVMARDGLLKAMNGVTSIEEVLRAVRS